MSMNHIRFYLLQAGRDVSVGRYLVNIYALIGFLCWSSTKGRVARNNRQLFLPPNEFVYQIFDINLAASVRGIEIA